MYIHLKKYTIENKLKTLSINSGCSEPILLSKSVGFEKFLEQTGSYCLGWTPM